MNKRTKCSDCEQDFRTNLSLIQEPYPSIWEFRGVRTAPRHPRGKLVTFSCALALSHRPVEGYNVHVENFIPSTLVEIRGSFSCVMRIAALIPERYKRRDKSARCKSTVFSPDSDLTFEFSKPKKSC